MIHIERKGPAPEALNGPKSIGGRERTRWTEYHTGKRRTKPSEFKAYGDDTVVVALREIFHQKCAYCEERISTGDVEHYRPKNAIIRDDGTRLPDGYWWLAADWDNLLWSCTTCNQRRKQQMPGVEGFVTAGKGAQFPIENTVTVQGPGDEKMEQPLLINPCVDVPEKHMFFAAEPGKENEGCLCPVVLAGGALDLKGKTTIEMLGLNNNERIKRRRELLDDLRERMLRIERLTMRINNLAPGAEYDRTKIELREELCRLVGKLAPDREDLMLARQVIHPFLSKLKTRS